MSSFYIKKNRKSWSLFEEIHTDGERSQKLVPVQAYPSFGLNPAATLEEARNRVKQINKEKKVERSKAASAARRVAKSEFYDDVFFPQVEVDEFLARTLRASAGSDDYKVRLVGGWKFAQKMILALKVLPQHYGDQAADFYDYFAKAKISVDYATEILAMVNNWGKYIAKKNSTFFEPVPKIPKTFRTKIAKAQRNKTGVRTESEALTVEILKKLKSKLTTEKYNWPFSSLWLGLRPGEVDDLASGPIKLLRSRDGSTKILECNQSKIETENEEDSLKYIPILYPEQEKAVELLKSKDVKRPTPKELKAASDMNLDTYSGRKGFVDLMQDKGQRFEDASMWLGHENIKMTRKHYKDAKNVPFTKVKK